jgi:hypothetical protein
MPLYRRGRSHSAFLVLPVERNVQRLAQLGVLEGQCLSWAGEQFEIGQLGVAFGAGPPTL